MASEIHDWVQFRLNNDDQIVQPLRKLWKDWRTFHDGPSFDDFCAIVLGDDRFEEMYSIDHDRSLESYGCFPGPRLKLRAREITPRHVLALLGKHNEQIARILREAAEASGNSVTEWDADLMEAVEIVEALRPAFNPWIRFRPSRRKSRPKTA